jgi:hypothetical protein
MKQKLNNLVQLLNKLESDLNEHINPHCQLTLLTHEGEPSVTYKINTKLLRMAIKLSRQHYVTKRKKDTYYPPGMHPVEIRERELREKHVHAAPPDYTPKSIKIITYENPKVYTDNIYSKIKENTKAQEEVTGYAWVD